MRRLEFEKKKEAEDKAAAEQIEAERAAMQAVDWWTNYPLELTHLSHLTTN